MVDALRGRVISGAWRTDEPIPSSRDLADELKVSPVTVLHALRRLTREGFLHSEHRKVATVVTYPPHVRDVALVFSAHEGLHDGRVGGSRFWTALAHAAKKVERRTPRWRFRILDNVSPHLDDPQYKKLLLWLRTRRLAGVFIPTDIELFLHSPVVSDLHTTTVSLSQWQKKLPDGGRSVLLDGSSWLDRAVAACQQAGRRRVAVLTGGDGGVLACPTIHGPKVRDCIGRCLQQTGCETCPEWLQLMDFTCPESVRGLVELMFSSKLTARPDALLVANDHAVGPALEGLQVAGRRVPEEVLVVGHANFPETPEVNLPVDFVGYDADEIVETVLAQVALGRPTVKQLPPVILAARAKYE